MYLTSVRNGRWQNILNRPLIGGIVAQKPKIPGMAAHSGQVPPHIYPSECQKAIDLSKEIVTQWLTDGMFKSENDPAAKASAVVAQLGEPTKTKLHSRHISADECAAMGLKIEKLEDDQELQDAVLSVHHACMHMLSSTPTVKIIRNHHGQAFNVRAAPRTA